MTSRPIIAASWKDQRLRRRSSFIVLAATIDLLKCTTFAQPQLAPAPQGVRTLSASGIEFAWIANAGNRPTQPAEVPLSPDLQIGSVGQEFGIARAELTVSQYLDFARSYVRWNPSAASDTSLLGSSLYLGNDGQVYMAARANPEGATSMTWRMAARYCNWLHNGKADSAAAFENGAYDTSTFVTFPDGSRSDQVTRSAGARFWIPSRDEWYKAAFFDPNRYGGGATGYWQYGNQSNAQSVSGLPWNGGQTSAGDGVPTTFPDALHLNVGAYSSTQSPWGLFDVSGGVSEWTETTGSLFSRIRFRAGTEYAGSILLGQDRIDYDIPQLGFPDSQYGFRIATSVPQPFAAMTLGIASVLTIVKRRR